MASYLHHTNIKAVLFRAAILIVVWWSFTDGSLSSWVIGLPAVLIAVYTSLKLLPSVNFSILGFIQFLPFFIQHSITGGTDVAVRAMRRGMKLNPELIEFRPRIEQDIPLFVMLSTVNLLPGTLCTDLRSGMLQIHVLDTKLDYLAELQAIEIQVARLFSLDLETDDHSGLRV